ncbi:MULTISPECIES: CvpA family protein [Psychrobacter]|uniref:Colicin V production protein n=1 Tax=Psychrobacter sp. (strain PRwf-1) TaxID=349106 RepID=A5WDZ4_PSYWF|nr:CvpA family protein [Psychrobacter sp. H7-1]
MGFLDIVIAIMVLAGLWRGFSAGFIRSAISLVGWFIALLAATRLADDVAPYLANVVSSPVLQMGAGFLAVVLIVMLVIQILTMLVSGIVKSLKLGFIDQLAGGVLGAFKNLLVVLVMLSVSAPVLVNTAMWQSSVLAPELLPYAPFAKEFATKVLGEAWQQIDVPDSKSNDPSAVDSNSMEQQ